MRLFFTAVLGVAIAVGAAWYFKLLGPTNDQNNGKHPDQLEQVDIGALLYKKEMDNIPDKNVPPKTATYQADPIVVPTHLTVFDKQRVPSPREGVLLFVGYEVKQSDPGQPGDTYNVTILQGSKEPIIKAYKRWKESSVVKPGQMLAMVDPAMALKEYEIKKAHVLVAQKEHKTAVATHAEAKAQLERTMKLPPGAVAAEEIGVKKLTKERYMYEEQAKFQGIHINELEVDKAEIFLRQHTIYNEMKGAAVIKQIFKKDGESIKGLEDFMELHNIEELKAEGTIGSQYLSRLKPGLSVTVEPMIEQPPYKTLPGHLRAVTAVAFNNNPKNLLVVSASEDSTVRVWLPGQQVPLKVWFHPRTINALACSPAKAEKDWCLTGCQDGKVRLWDLNKFENVWEKEVPGGAAITVVAFSPDGRFFATGSEDNSINIWETKTGNYLYQFNSEHGVNETHQGAITALTFTPQCRLVSASKDNTIRVWELHVNGAKLVPPVIENRSGTVANLGVSHDGRLMLFDKGKELQVLTVPDAQPRGVLQNLMFNSFETLALFSPDSNSSLILTAGAPEGRLQLWRTPLDGNRPYEVRQWAPKERSPVTCAAFAPGAGGAQQSWAASGCKDGYLYLWEVPGHAEVENHPIRGLKLEQVPYTIEGGSQARIGITVPNPVSELYPKGRLQEGGSVTVVIE